MNRSPNEMVPQLRDAVAEIVPSVIADRRYLHQHPEVAYGEEQTARFVADRLRALSVDDIRTGIATTGVTALIHGTAGTGTRRTVLLRADMDALPIQEANEVVYRSQHPGVMHACGHDGHVAILLGAARLLLERRDQFAGTVKLCFQPAEEATPTGGALPMIEAGVLTDPPVDAAFGLHLVQRLPVGIVGVRAGAVMATGTVFRIVVRGRGGHASNPHLAVVTVSSFHAGDGIGVIPEHAELRGLVKAFDDDLRDALVGRLETLARGIAGAMRAEV